MIPVLIRRDVLSKVFSLKVGLRVVFPCPGARGANRAPAASSSTSHRSERMRASHCVARAVAPSRACAADAALLGARLQLGRAAVDEPRAELLLERALDEARQQRARIGAQAVGGARAPVAEVLELATTRSST